MPECWLLGLTWVGIWVVFPQRCSHAKGKEDCICPKTVYLNYCLSCFFVHAEFRQRELQKTRGKFSSAWSWVLPSSALKAHSRLSPYASPSSLLHQKIWASFALPVGPQVSAQKLPQMPLVSQKHGLSHWPLVGWQIYFTSRPILREL